LKKPQTNFAIIQEESLILGISCQKLFFSLSTLNIKLTKKESDLSLEKKNVVASDEEFRFRLGTKGNNRDMGLLD